MCRLRAYYQFGTETTRNSEITLNIITKKMEELTPEQYFEEKELGPDSTLKFNLLQPLIQSPHVIKK